MFWHRMSVRTFDPHYSFIMFCSIFYLIATFISMIFIVPNFAMKTMQQLNSAMFLAEPGTNRISVLKLFKTKIIKPTCACFILHENNAFDLIFARSAIYLVFIFNHFYSRCHFIAHSPQQRYPLYELAEQLAPFIYNILRIFNLKVLRTLDQLKIIPLINFAHWGVIFIRIEIYISSYTPTLFN